MPKLCRWVVELVRVHFVALIDTAVTAQVEGLVCFMSRAHLCSCSNAEGMRPNPSLGHFDRSPSRTKVATCAEFADGWLVSNGGCSSEFRGGRQSCCNAERFKK